jgi:hypothetical protein
MSHSAADVVARMPDANSAATIGPAKLISPVVA